MARHGRLPSPAPATRSFLFTGRQVFLLERTRPPNHGFHETRDTRHESQLSYPRFPTISHDFPAFPGPPTPPPPIKCPRAVRLSWSAARDCRPRSVAAFLRVVARHGAAMARHGRHGAPRAAVRAPSAPATGPFGFSRNPRPEARLLQGARQVPAQVPRFSRNTRHETRITAFSSHGFVESLPLGTEGLQSFFRPQAGLG